VFGAPAPTETYFIKSTLTRSVTTKNTDTIVTLTIAFPFTIDSTVGGFNLEIQHNAKQSDTTKGYIYTGLNTGLTASGSVITDLLPSTSAASGGTGDWSGEKTTVELNKVCGTTTCTAGIQYMITIGGIKNSDTDLVDQNFGMILKVLDGSTVKVQASPDHPSTFQPNNYPKSNGITVGSVVRASNVMGATTTVTIKFTPAVAITTGTMKYVYVALPVGLVKVCSAVTLDTVAVSGAKLLVDAAAKMRMGSLKNSFDKTTVYKRYF
jgi:hypothetical protein